MRVPEESHEFWTPYRSCINSPIWQSVFEAKMPKSGLIRFEMINKSILRGEENLGWATIPPEIYCGKDLGDIWLNMNVIKYKSKGTALHIAWEKEAEWKETEEEIDSKIVVFVPSKQGESIILYPCNAKLHKSGKISIPAHPPVIFHHEEPTLDEIIFGGTAPAAKPGEIAAAIPRSTSEPSLSLSKLPGAVLPSKIDS